MAVCPPTGNKKNYTQSTKTFRDSDAKEDIFPHLTLKYIYNNVTLN